MPRYFRMTARRLPTVHLKMDGDMTSQIATAGMVFFGLLATPSFASEGSQDSAGCMVKQGAIRAQIEQARAAGNTWQQSGLETALTQVKANCTDAGLKKQHTQKVDKARKEVSQRKADLKAAMQSGNVEKINKRKQKLAESQQELETALAQPRPD